MHVNSVQNTEIPYRLAALIVDVITKVDNVSINDSNVHQIGKKSSLNENQQSVPILISGNANGAQIPSPGQRVVDIMSHGVMQLNNGDGWSRVNHTGNDASANLQSTPKQAQFNNTLDYLNNSEGKLITPGKNMFFSGSKSLQNYCDNEAPQMTDFVNHGGPRRVIAPYAGLLIWVCRRPFLTYCNRNFRFTMV